jgi:hypothetical protein
MPIDARPSSDVLAVSRAKHFCFISPQRAQARFVRYTKVHLREEEPSMRLRQQEGRVVAQFSFRWEAAILASLEDCWMPLYLPERLDAPVGAIHSTTHEVRLRSDQMIADRQVVVLGTHPTNDLPG